MTYQQACTLRRVINSRSPELRYDGIMQDRGAYVLNYTRLDTHQVIMIGSQADYDQVARAIADAAARVEVVDLEAPPRLEDDPRQTTIELEDQAPG